MKILLVLVMLSSSIAMANTCESLFVASEESAKVSALDKQDEKGRTSLALAILNGNIELVVSLLHSGANPNIKDANGDTPYHYAIYFLSAHPQIFSRVEKLLLQNYANSNIQNSRGQSPKNILSKIAGRYNDQASQDHLNHLYHTNYEAYKEEIRRRDKEYDDAMRDYHNMYRKDKRDQNSQDSLR